MQRRWANYACLARASLERPRRDALPRTDVIIDIGEQWGIKVRVFSLEGKAVLGGGDEEMRSNARMGNPDLMNLSKWRRV